MNLKKSVAETLTNGYLSMMALFFAAAFLAMKLGWSLSMLSWIWIPLIAIFVSMLAIVWRKAHGAAKPAVNRVLVIGMVLTVVVSIGFTRPYAEDATLEIVNSAVAANHLVQSFAPIEMLYASFAKFTGLESATVLYYVFPIFLLGFFFAGIWRLGSALFDEEEKVAEFELFVIGIYWMTAFLEGQSVVTGIFLNSWNGLTWLSCFVMPVVLANCLEWMKQAEAGKMQGMIKKIGMAVIMLLAGQLTNEKGGFYVALMLFLAIAVIIVRKGYDYGITSGRFKKRV
ncbi:MAG: hypothetical protein IJZ23_09185 [Roseburia sp.]|nr:hypothetical protein [Roseburia sp.]